MRGFLLVFRFCVGVAIRVGFWEVVGWGFWGMKKLPGGGLRGGWLFIGRVGEWGTGWLGGALCGMDGAVWGRQGF